MPGHVQQLHFLLSQEVAYLQLLKPGNNSNHKDNGISIRISGKA